jgi:hypothetical protein
MRMGMTCWRRLRDWQAAGVWNRLHEVLLSELHAAERTSAASAKFAGSLNEPSVGSISSADYVSVGNDTRKCTKCFSVSQQPSSVTDFGSTRTSFVPRLFVPRLQFIAGCYCFTPPIKVCTQRQIGSPQSESESSRSTLPCTTSMSRPKDGSLTENV